MMTKLDREEREILDAFERGTLQPIPEKEAELKKHQEYAAATFKPDQRVSIRLSSKDLTALQKRALVEGIPYQTLMASILHKYVDGQLTERAAHKGGQRTRSVRQRLGRRAVKQ
jgi:predicted DNA binding CopG/RHH family protein